MSETSKLDLVEAERDYWRAVATRLGTRLGEIERLVGDAQHERTPFEVPEPPVGTRLYVSNLDGTATLNWRRTEEGWDCGEPQPCRMCPADWTSASTLLWRSGVIRRWPGEPAPPAPATDGEPF